MNASFGSSGRRHLTAHAQLTAEMIAQLMAEGRAMTRSKMRAQFARSGCKNTTYGRKNSCKKSSCGNHPSRHLHYTSTSGANTDFCFGGGCTNILTVLALCLEIEISGFLRSYLLLHI